jgi:hypothetical protein
MPSYTSRAQDAAQKVKEAEIEVERADAKYRKGAGCQVLTKAQSNLNAAHAEYDRVVSGRCSGW